MIFDLDDAILTVTVVSIGELEMAEENKQPTTQCLMFATKLICGIAILALGIWILKLWRWEVLALVKGFTAILVIAIGIVILATAKE